MRAARMARRGRGGMPVAVVNGPRRLPAALAGKTVVDFAGEPSSSLELRQNRLAESLVIFIGHGRQHGLEL
jgi:hypothetical protein